MMSKLGNLKLGTKLWGLIVLLLVAVTIVSASSIWSIKGILAPSSRYSEAAGHEIFFLKKEIESSFKTLKSISNSDFSFSNIILARAACLSNCHSANKNPIDIQLLQQHTES